MEYLIPYKSEINIFIKIFIMMSINVLIRLNCSPRTSLNREYAHRPPDAAPFQPILPILPDSRQSRADRRLDRPVWIVGRRGVSFLAWLVLRLPRNSRIDNTCARSTHFDYRRDWTLLRSSIVNDERKDLAIEKTRIGCGNRIRTGRRRLVSATRRTRVSNAVAMGKSIGDHVAADVAVAPSPRWRSPARDRANRTRGLLPKPVFYAKRASREKRFARASRMWFLRKIRSRHVRNYRGNVRSSFLNGLLTFRIVKDFFFPIFSIRS